MTKKINKYKKNYIKLVVLRLDFKRLENFNIKDFTSLKFLKDYPIEKKQQKIDFLATLSKEKQTVDKVEYDEHRYYDSNMRNCVCFSGDTIFFEIKSHFSYEKLRKQFSEIFKTLDSKYKIESFNRIGLRYVNEVEGFKEEYFSKDLLINQSFLKSLIGKHKSFEEALSLGRMGLKNDNTTTNFVYGKPNKNYPAKQTDQIFLLDYDSFATGIDRDDLLDIIDKLHQNIGDLFEASITATLKKEMNKDNER
jgi:uncharacterized protein (TIGR04255 family)